MSEAPTPNIVIADGAVPLPDDAATFLGRVIDGYRIERLLGEGGMAWVFEVSMAAFQGAKAAMKMPKRVATSEADLKQLFSHFEHEASVVFGLRNQHIVHPRSYGHLPDGRPYLVMDLLEGATLADYVATRGRLTAPEALRFTIQLATGLAAAHAAGVIHRDLKPGNIFVDTHEVTRVAELDVPTLRLTDFGLAFRAGRDAMHAGTPEYLSPEQARGDQPDARADLYSLGVVLFEMLTGSLPFSGGSALELMQHHLSTRAPDVRTLEPSLHEDLAALVAKLLEKDPPRRFQTATELRNTVENRLKQLENRAEPTNVVKLSELEARGAATAPTARVLPAPIRRAEPKTDEALAKAFPQDKSKGKLAVAFVVALLLGIGLVALIAGGKGGTPATTAPAPVVVAPVATPAPPPVAAPVPPAPQPVVATATPAPTEPTEPAVDPLAPLPAAGANPVKAPKPPRAATPKDRVVVETTSACDPDADWKKGARATLEELTRRAAKTSPDLMLWAADQESVISTGISTASTKGECAAVEGRLADFKKKLKIGTAP